MSADPITMLFIGLFVGVMIGIGIMSLIQPYCCRMQPEIDE